MIPLTVFQILGQVKTLKDLVEPEIEICLIRIGKIHWAAAKKHLSNAQLSNVVNREEVLLAVGALELAYQFWMDARPKAFWLWLGLTPTLERAKNCYYFGCIVSLVQSRCYKILKSPDLSRRYAEQAKECFKNYIELEISMRKLIIPPRKGDKNYYLKMRYLEMTREEIAQKRKQFQDNYDQLVASDLSESELVGETIMLDLNEKL
jgi:hypothetical protein